MLASAAPETGPPPVKEKEKKVKEAKGYKQKLKRHKDAVLIIHSVDGMNGDFLMSGSADHTVRRKYHPITVNLFQKYGTSERIGSVTRSRWIGQKKMNFTNTKTIRWTLLTTRQSMYSTHQVRLRDRGIKGLSQPIVL